LRIKQTTFIKGLLTTVMVMGVFMIRSVPAWADTATATTADGTADSSQTAGTGDSQVGTPPATTDPTTTTTTDPATPPVTPDTSSTTTPTATDPTVTSTTTTTTTTPDTSSATDPSVQPNTNPTDPNSGNNATVNTDNTVTNNLGADANTGDASVTDANNGGAATTGDAANLVNLLNMLNSTTGLTSGNLQTFVDNITGDVNGDITIDPNLLNALVNSQGGQGNGGNTSLTDNTSATLNNNVDLNATSGDASVTDNKRGGTALSGDATNLLNLINLLNSNTTAGQTLLGIINIYGNLNGNILLPPGFLDMLLASGSSGSGGSPPDPNGSTQVNLDNNAAINNNITQTATTGDATVTDSSNRGAGTAATGDATNNLNIFNLTGQQINAANDLLVFVNVLGKWVGLILNAPAGTNMGEFGGGVTQNITNPSGGNTDVNVANNLQINNNINMTATTGDASVTAGRGGTATTGNATNSANVLNIVDSNFSVSNWFGILFINVFGSWNGSLQLAPAVVTPQTPPAAPGAAPAGPSVSADNTGTSTGNGSHNFYSLVSSIVPSIPGNQSSGNVQGASTSVLPTDPGMVTHFNWLLPIGGFCITLTLLCGERLVASRGQ